MKWKTVYRITLAFLLILVALSVFSPQVVAQNTPPIVDAGPDQTIYVGEATGLEGSGWDPDGNWIVEWLWTVESAPAGSTVYLSMFYVPTPTFSADMAGEYVLSLIASDGLDWSDPDYVTITLLEILPPVAIATADVTSGPAPLTVNFDGSQSYARYGTELIYDWDFGDGSPISTEVSPTHVYLFHGCTYVAVLTVIDSIGQNDHDTIEITVYEEEPPPPVEDTEEYIEYVGQTMQDLPDEIFNMPEEDVSDAKNDFSEALLNDTWELIIIDENYEKAIEKLNEIKEDIEERMVASAEREEIISLINDLIAYLESLL